MQSPDLVPSFLAALKGLGIPQRQVAKIIGCSETLISKAASGERSITIPDLEGLLGQLATLYPEHRAEIAEAALGSLLARMGLRLRLVVEPPPAAPAGVTYLDEYRAQRGLRRAA